MAFIYLFGILFYIIYMIRTQLYPGVIDYFS